MCIRDRLCGVKNGAMSSAINFSNPQQKLNRNRVKKFNLALNSQKIDDFINCDVIWDDIESIEFVGKKHVYDLQTNNNHNYLANNIVVHNCMGKKDLKKMQTYKQQWIEGCQKISNMHPFDAEALWNKIEAFAGYGFNKCLDGDIVLDGYTQTIAELAENRQFSTLKSYNTDTKDFFLDFIEDISYAGKQMVYEYELSNGKTLRCTSNHKFLCEDGEYHTIQDIVENNLEMVDAEN